MKILKTPHHDLVFAEFSDLPEKTGTVYFRTDINGPPGPSVRMEQTVNTICNLREHQEDGSNILIIAHASKAEKSIEDNFKELKTEVLSSAKNLALPLENILFARDLNELKKLSNSNKNSIVFLENIRKICGEELVPPSDSTKTDFWEYFTQYTKINGALSCCHRDALSLRLFADGCYCNDSFISELYDITQLYTDTKELKLWGVAGAKAEKLDAIRLTEGRDDLMVVLDGGPVFVLLLWALYQKAPSLKKTLPASIGKENTELIEKFYTKNWEKVKENALEIAKKIEGGSINMILPIDVNIKKQDGTTKTVNLKEIGEGKFESIGPNSITMIGNMAAKRIFLQNGSWEERKNLDNGKGESTTNSFCKEVLNKSSKFFINGGDTVSDIRTLENVLKLSKYREKGKLKELAVGGFVVHWWKYLYHGKYVPHGVKYAEIGSFRTLYTKMREQRGFD
ncbi:MAG TPA: phosphoglycerate kinase [Methanofastidiosum sp.]|nr:phosphoglycerate kinase [Methanofastidiosum sp.]HOR88727.1 phosphoglycerate kinase [Methanofastidiosum sp.]HPL00761.1 phosphoglycerate kinase [Methanofastidiosum sp.]